MNEGGVVFRSFKKQKDCGDHQSPTDSPNVEENENDEGLNGFLRNGIFASSGV